LHAGSVLSMRSILQLGDAMREMRRMPPPSRRRERRTGWLTFEADRGVRGRIRIETRAKTPDTFEAIAKLLGPRHEFPVAQVSSPDHFGMSKVMRIRGHFIWQNFFAGRSARPLKHIRYGLFVSCFAPIEVLGT
jgi:hypothetical protein